MKYWWHSLDVLFLFYLLLPDFVLYLKVLQSSLDSLASYLAESIIWYVPTHSIIICTPIYLYILHFYFYFSNHPHVPLNFSSIVISFSFFYLLLLFKFSPRSCSSPILWIHSHESLEKGRNSYEDETLSGMLKLCAAVVRQNPSFKESNQSIVRLAMIIFFILHHMTFSSSFVL